MSKHSPAKNEKDAIKNRLLSGESVVLLDHFSVRVDVNKGRRFVNIPSLEERNAEADIALLDEHPRRQCGERLARGLSRSYMLNPEHPEYRDFVLDPAIKLRERVRSQLAAIRPSEFAPSVNIKVLS